jgi:hypothetical protein
VRKRYEDLAAESGSRGSALDSGSLNLARPSCLQASIRRFAYLDSAGDPWKAAPRYRIISLSLFGDNPILNRCTTPNCTQSSQPLALLIAVSLDQSAAKLKVGETNKEID